MKKKTNGQLLWEFLKGSKALFICCIICSSISSLMDMVTPQIIRAAIDNAVGGKPSTFPDFVNRAVDSMGGFAYLGKHLWIMALMVMAVAAVRAAAQFGTTMFNTCASEVLVKSARDRLFSHIERLPYEWHQKNQTGDIIQRCTSDVDRLRTFVAEQLTSLFRIGIYLILSLFFMFSMNVKLGLVALIPIPVIVVYSVVFRREMEEGFRICDEEEGVVSTAVQENLTGVRVVRAFAQEKNEKERFEKENEYYTGLWKKMGMTIGRFFSIQDFLSGMQILLVVGFGAVFAVKGQMTAGEYVAFINYNAMLEFPIRRLGRMISEMSKAGVSIERLGYIICSEEEKDRDGAAADVPMNGDIVFDHVSFAYEGCPEIIKDVSFTVKAGTTLGILGGTGSGKSTLMLLLDKLYRLKEGNGSISIGGVDIEDIQTEYLRKNIAMVLQEPFLFSRTIKENIGITMPDVDMNEVERAARDACLDGSVESFAKGYDTFVGERGVTLSGGQKQRTAIARALIGNSPIMIFDDSLSAVDNETDAKIRAALQEKFGTATIIIISHRITTLSKADQVIVLEDGRVTEHGSPQDLKSAGGMYQKIYEIQLGAGKEADCHE